MAQDLDNFAPRAGVVFMPGADGRTVVRGGFGVYDDQGFNNMTKLSFQQDRLERYLAWYDRYLRESATASQPVPR